MNAGESPRNQGLSVKGVPVRLQKAVSRSRENAAVERREVNAHRTGRAPQGVSMLPRLSALRSPHTFGEGAPPRERGDGNARRSPRLAKTGAAELWVLDVLARRAV